LGNKKKKSPLQHKQGYQKDAPLKGRLQQSVFKMPEKIFHRLYQGAYGTVGAAAIVIKNSKAMVFCEKGGGKKTKTKGYPKKPEPVHRCVSITGDPARHFLQVP
jgi:hypothetical protein